MKIGDFVNRVKDSVSNKKGALAGAFKNVRKIPRRIGVGFALVNRTLQEKEQYIEAALKKGIKKGFVDLANKDLSGVDFSKFENLFGEVAKKEVDIDLSGTNLENTVWQDVEIANFNFEKSDLTNSIFKNINKGSKPRGKVNFNGAALKNVRWENVSFASPSFVAEMEPSLEGAFKDSELINIDLGYSRGGLYLQDMKKVNGIKINNASSFDGFALKFSNSKNIKNIDINANDATVNFSNVNIDGFKLTTKNLYGLLIKDSFISTIDCNIKDLLRELKILNSSFENEAWNYTKGFNFKTNISDGAEAIKAVGLNISMILEDSKFTNVLFPVDETLSNKIVKDCVFTGKDIDNQEGTVLSPDCFLKSLDLNNKGGGIDMDDLNDSLLS